jgi:Family of unknown function (DUF6117)
MSLLPGHITNFETMLKAALDGKLALLECTDVVTGKPVATVVMVNHEGNEVVFVPVAKLFDDNPYDELEPPMFENKALQ